ncbi:hypothetical protein BDV96DRAFT_155152 [Lophiotrema nucula]|uniref:Uncharacterized protein n=1 Tax=Lophiotrema nucula TaxID=690887 RepID=A0A6A5YZP7_9PLEO|nr:hypothetical protein BDV96DRAFT_155152 [Lophiotrema nucula]
MDNSNPMASPSFEIGPTFDLLEEDLFSEFIEYPPITPENVRHSGFISFAEYNSAPLLPLRSHQPQPPDTHQQSLLSSSTSGNSSRAVFLSKVGRTPQRRSKPQIAAPYPTLPYPGQGLLTLSSAAAPTRKPRSCFTPGRRKEVKEVRNRGACLRCTLLKRRVGILRSG